MSDAGQNPEAQRLERLEESAMFADRGIEELSEQMAALQEQMKRLTARLAALEGRLATLTADEDDGPP